MIFTWFKDDSKENKIFFTIFIKVCLFVRTDASFLKFNKV